MLSAYKVYLILIFSALLLSACQPINPTPDQPTAPEAVTESEELPLTETTQPEPSEFLELEMVGIDVLLGEITSPALADNLIGDPETRNVMIQLPPSYATTNQRYPVVYVLHGYTGDELWMIREVGGAMKKLLEEGSANEMILVYPNANNKFYGSWYMSSPTIGDYETYLTQDLVSFIDTNFRTLSQRTSRGVTGCSMGGDGAMHLALTYPDVYSVAAPVSSSPDSARDSWEDAQAAFQEPPADFQEFQRLPFDLKELFSLAAVASPNPDKPPFYLDMPYEIVGDEVKPVPEVFDRIVSMDMVHDVDRYLSQPTRLENILLYHGKSDYGVPVEEVRDFDELLSDAGIRHEYLEVPGGHCNLDYKPVLQFMSDNLTFEKP